MPIPKAKITTELRPEALEVRIEGVLNEDINLTALLDTIRASGKERVDFDLGGLQRINSCGIREWLLFMQQIAPVARIEFLRISEVFVQQANLVPTMLGKIRSRVQKFEAPFACGSCGTREMIWAEPEQVVGGELTVAGPACSQCSQSTELDVLPEEYFRFLRA